MFRHSENTILLGGPSFAAPRLGSSFRRSVEDTGVLRGQGCRGVRGHEVLFRDSRIEW